MHPSHTLALGAVWLTTAALSEPLVRTAAWGVLWLCHILAGYPEPPSYSAWMPGL